MKSFLSIECLKLQEPIPSQGIMLYIMKLIEKIHSTDVDIAAPN